MKRKKFNRKIYKEMELRIHNEIEKSDKRNFFSCRFLLRLIEALLEEQFAGTYSLDVEGLTIAFPEGQKFLLKIEEL